MSGEWIKWAGGECPVEQHTRVDVEFRDTTTWFDKTAGCLDDFDPMYSCWHHDDDGGDIVAYRVVQP